MVKHCTIKPKVKRGVKPEKATFVDQLKVLKGKMFQDSNAIVTEDIETDVDYQTILQVCKTFDKDTLNAFGNIAFEHVNFKGKSEAEVIHGKANAIALWFLSEREVRNPRIGVTASPLYGNLNISSILAGIYDDVDFIYDKYIADRLKKAILELNSKLPNSKDFKKVFNPNSVNMDSFDEFDTRHIVKVLIRTYLTNKEILDDNDSIKNYRDFKKAIIELLKTSINEARSQGFKTAFNEKHVKVLLDELNSKNSYLYNSFLKYLKNQYGIDRFKFKTIKKSIDDKSIEELEDDEVEEVINKWDEDAKLKLDLRTSLSSRAKLFIAREIALNLDNTDRSTKFYLVDPVDINTVWNKLVNMYSSCRTIDEYYNKTKAVVKTQPHLKPLLTVFEEARKKGASINDVSMAKTIMTAIGSLSKTPVSIVSIQDGVGKLFDQNRDSFPEKLAVDKFEDSIDSFDKTGGFKQFTIESDLYKDFVKSVKLLNSNLSKLNYNRIADRQIELLKILHIPVSSSALKIHYGISENSNDGGNIGNNVIVNKAEAINNTILNIASHIAKKIVNKSGKYDISGWLYDLACIEGCDFDAQSSFTYLDVKGELNYTPQYDSFLTRFTRGWVVNGVVDSQKVYESFKPYLEDSTINFGNTNNPLFNHGTDKFIRGLFTKINDKWELTNDAKNAIKSGKLFKISQFNGIKIDEVGYKYQQDQGDLFAYTLFILAASNEFLLLTSDSPRSYTVSYQPTTVDDLFNTEGRKLRFESKDVNGHKIDFIQDDIILTNFEVNIESVIFKELSHIVYSDINKLRTIGSKLLAEFPIDKYNNKTWDQLTDSDKQKLFKYHNVKYWDGSSTSRLDRPVIYKNSEFTGRSLQCLNLSYVENDKTVTLLDFIQSHYPDVNIMDNLSNLDIIVTDFVKSYINNVIEIQLPKTQGIANELFETVSSIRNISTFDTSMLQADVENVYNELLEELINGWDATHKISWEEYSTNSKYKNSYKNKLAEIKQNAESKVTSQKDIYTSDGYIRFVLEAVLNRTVQSHFYAEIFQGDIEEYTGTVDYNKRIAQTIKNGLNSADAINADESNSRKVLVVEDWVFGSNITSKLFNDKGGIVNEALKKAHSKLEKVNDSQSFITDKGLIELLKATGRWHKNEPLYRYITDLTDGTKPFDPTTYGKLVEQLKLFATARRTRGEFLPIYGDDAVLGSEVDSIQIKDSTIVLFKTMVAGSDLEFLYDEMVDADIHQISPISAVKVSGVTPYRIHDENGAFVKGSLSNEASYKHAVLNMKHSDFVIQQDIPADMLDEKIILGNQLIKQMMEGLNWNEAIYTLDGKAVTGREIFDEFQNILATNIEEDFLKLFFDIVKVDTQGYIQLNPNGTIAVDTVKLTQLFQEHVARDTQSANIRKMLKLGKNDNIMDNISLSNPIIYAALQNVITSTFTKAVANKYMSGFHAPIRADIMTVDGRLISHKELYKTPEHYDEIIDEFTQNSAITWSSSFIDRCKAEGRPLTLRAEHRNENGQDVWYAEVITSVWNSEFFTNIGTTKEINGRLVQTIDLDKLDDKSKQMLGIRIPTEGKQSMVVFEVVGILNTGATQAIFPQTLVNRTGWDFDIDSIYAYYRNVKFNGNLYTPIEFNTNFEAETEQKRHNFGSSLLESEIRKIELNAYSNREDLGNILTLRKDIVTNVESFRKHIDSVLESLVFTENESKVASLNKIKDLLKKFESAHDFYYRNQVAFNKFDVDTNDFNFTRSTIKDKHSMTKPLHSAIVNMIQHLNDIESLIENNELTELSDDFANLNNFENYTSYSNTLKTNIAKIQKAKSDLQIKKSKNEITESVAKAKEVEIAQKETNIQSLVDWYDNISDLTISEFLSNFIDGIDINISYLNEQINTNVIGSTDNVYKSNSRDARDNRLLDIMIEVHTNPYHAEAVNTPNAMDELIYISDVINDIYKFDIDKLNPHDMFDAITLNNMSMGSTILKGHSVNFDSFLAVLSTLNGRLAKALRHPVHIEDLPIPTGWTKEDVYKKSGNSYTLTEKYEAFLDDRLGYTEKVVKKEGVSTKEKVHRFTVLPERGIVIFRDAYINNDSKNEHLDISGEQIGSQMKQFTTAILDILKSNLGFNINTDTLSIARVLSMGCVMETFNNKDGVPVNNRYAYSMLFVHQPIIVDIINNLNRSKIVNPHYNVNNSFNKIYNNLINDIIAKYIELSKNDSSYKLPDSLHDKLIELSKNVHNIKSDSMKSLVSDDSDKQVSLNDLIDQIASNIGSSVRVYSATQTSRDLKQNMFDRKSTNPIDQLKFMISQLNILHLFNEYKTITDEVVNLQFILKTEGKLKNFNKVDNNNKQLADYYYSNKSLLDELGNNYKESKESIEEDEPDVVQKIKDFYTLTTSEYIRIWGEQDDTFITFVDWKQAQYEIYQANDLASKTEFVTKYKLGSVKNSVVILPDGSDIVDSVFPQAFETYVRPDGTFNTKDTSKYKVIQSRFLKGSNMVHTLFDSVFILRNPLVKNELQSQLYANNKFITDENLKRLNDAIINEFVNLNIFGDKNIVSSEHKDTYKLILGINEGSEEEITNFNEDQVKLVKKLSELDLINCSENQFGKAFGKFAKLTLANQLTVLKNNSALNTYINNDPIFGKNNIFKYIRLSDNVYKIGYQNIILQVKEDDTDVANAITNSIAYMWNSNIPFVAHTIRQIIMHTYITKGIRYGFNIGKYIPTEILSKQIINDNYKSLCKEYKVVDVAENLHNYNNILIQINNMLNQVECPIDVKEIVKIAISKNSSLVQKVYNDSQKQFIWENHPHTATMGHVVGLNIQEIIENPDGSKEIKYGSADQLALKAYTDGNGVKRVIFFETEDRLVNSKYCNSELVSMYNKNVGKRITYKRILATPMEVLPERKIYAYVPVQRSLANENIFASESTSSIIGKYDNANKVQIVNEVESNKTTELIAMEDFLQTLGLQYDAIRKAINDAKQGVRFEISTNEDPQNPTPEPSESTANDGNYSDEDVTSQQDAVDLTTDMDNSNVNTVYDLKKLPIDNIISKKGSLSQAINDAIEESDNSIYITRSGRQTHTPTGGLNIMRGYHKDSIQIDYTKSPKDEALRIAKQIKSGKLYINGDLLEHADKSFQDIYFWTQTFMNNLKIVAPQINEVITIVNNGFGEAIARSSFDAKRTNINIYDDEATLYSEVLVHDPTINPIENTFINNGDIAIELMRSIRKIGKFFTINNFDIAKSFKDLIAKFEDIEEVEYNLETSIRENDRIVIAKTYDIMVEIASSIMGVCKQYEQLLRNLNYEEIRNNYNLVQDYKRQLNELLNLLGHFNKYAQLQQIDINNTIYDPDNEEDVAKFESEFGSINQSVKKLQSLYLKSRTMQNFALDGVKRTIIWRVIEDSRNPKYTTHFSKLLEYLEAHDYDISGIQPSDLEISAEEWLEMEHAIFALNKDITKYSALLDSGMVTGNTLVDMLGKAYTQANDEAVEYSHKRLRELENILESYQKGLFSNRSAREALMHELIDEHGNFISTYNTVGLSSKIYVLKSEIKTLIAESFNTPTGERNDEIVNKLQDDIKALIEKFNNDNELYDLEILSIDEVAKHNDELNYLNSRQKFIYLQTNHLVEIPTGDNHKVLYKVNFAEAAKSEAFKRLSPEKQQVLAELKALTNRIIQDHIPGWTNDYGAYDSFVPYIPKATISNALKGYISVPRIHHDKTYETIGGLKRYALSAETLKIPTVYHEFKLKGVNAKTFGETQVMYEARMVEAFNEWRLKHDVLGISKEAVEFKDITKFNEQIKVENSKHKAKTMSYDIVDVMTGFVQEMANLQSINNWHLDYDLARTILNKDTGNGSPMSNLKNLAKQVTSMEERIVDVSKIHSTLDQLAGGLLRFTSVSFMYLNYTAGLTNILKGVTDALTYTATEGLIGGKELVTKGFNEIMKAVIPYLQDINSLKTDNMDVAIIKHFDAIYQDTRDVTSSLTASGMWTRILQYADKYGYGFNSMGEFIMQYGMLLACTESHRVVGGKIMAFQDFYRTKLSEKLMPLLNDEQKREYDRFVENLDNEIRKEENRSKVEYMWDHDYASAYIKTHLNQFDKETREKLVDAIEKTRKTAKEAFAKYPTLKSQFELQDGQLAMKEESGVSKTELSNFRSRVKSINQSLHGIYDRVNRNALQDNAYGNLLMQFRKWVIPNWNRLWGRRFGHTFYNEQLGAYETPVFNTAFDMHRAGKQAYKDSLGDDKTIIGYAKAVCNYFKGVLSFISNIRFYYNTLPTHERVAAVQFAKLVGAIAFAFVTAALLSGLRSDDDDENENNKWYTHILYVVTSWYQEMVGLVPPFGLFATVKQFTDNAFAGEKALLNAGKLIGLLTKMIYTDEDDMRYDRGVYKGEHKAWVTFKQLMPVMRQINKYQHLGQTMSWYRMYNFVGNPDDIVFNVVNQFTKTVFNTPIIEEDDDE